MSAPSDTPTAFSITLASLANGAGRASAEVDNTTNNYLAARISGELTSGGVAPTAGQIYRIYLLFNDNDGSNPIRTDDWDGTDSVFSSPENAQLLGSIVVTATTAKEFRFNFDTWPLGPLTPEWGIAIYNDSGAALSSTEADSFIRYWYYTPDAPV